MNQTNKQTKILSQQLQYHSGSSRITNKVKRRFVAYEPPSLIANTERENTLQTNGESNGVLQQRNRIMQQYQRQLWMKVGEIINQKDQSRMKNLQQQLQQKTKLIQQIINQNKESRERQAINEKRQTVQKKQHYKLQGLFHQLQIRYNECDIKLKQCYKTCELQQEQLIDNRNKLNDLQQKLQNLQGINESISEQLKQKNQQLESIRNSNDQFQRINSIHKQSNSKLSAQLTALSQEIIKLNTTLLFKQQAFISTQAQLNKKVMSLQQANKIIQSLRQQNIKMTTQHQKLTSVNQQLRIRIQNTDISKNLADQLRSKIQELIELRRIKQDLQKQNQQHSLANQISKKQIDQLKQSIAQLQEKNTKMQSQILRMDQINQQIKKTFDQTNKESKQKAVIIEVQRSKNQQMLLKISNLQEINKSIAQQLRLKIESIIEIRKITQDLQNKSMKKQQEISNLKNLINKSPPRLAFIESPFVSISATQTIIQQKILLISTQYSQAVSCPLQQLNLARFVSESSAPSSEHFLQQKFSQKSLSENPRQKAAFRMKSEYHRSQSIDSSSQIQQQFDYRANIQAKCKLLQKQLQLKTNQFLTVSQLLHQKQNELYPMRQQFQNYSNLINQLRKRIQQLQKQPIIYHRPIESVNMQQKMNHWHQLINNINRNCLKNNCDSTGIINIQLNGIQQKTMIDFINLSPTDIEKFNKKQDIVDFNNDHNYGVNSRAQNEAYHLYRSDDSLDPRKEMEMKESASFSRKISVQSDNYAEKEAAANKIALQKENEHRICHTQSQQVQNIVPVQAPTSPSKQNDVSQCGENGKSLSICNNANSQFKLTYQQLNQKCLRIERQNEKMWQYLRLLHGLNHKWKKSSAEIDHQSKINVLGKLSEKVNNLLQRDRHSENQQMVANQLLNLIKDVQNYIHFLDHLIKIQPFQDGHRTPYHPKKPQATSENNANHLYSKKTYSQGCCRQDEYIQNFDIYPYELEQIPREDLRKEVEKKELFEMEKFNNQQKKDWFSEISSVKNQSQSEMSKSELIQLQMYMRGNFIREQADSFKEAKRDHNDSSKVEHKSFTQLRQMYQKLRDQYQQLLREKNSHQKMHRKQIERIQGDYIKKMSKMTKDFNDTFGLLCQRSGLHKRERPVQKQCYHREIQVDVESAPLMRKKSHSRTSFQDREVGMKTQEMLQNATQQLQFQLKDSQQKLKESILIQQKYKDNIVDLQKEIVQRQETIDKLSKWLTVQKKNEEMLQIKFTSDFKEFIRKITVKNNIQDVNLDINNKEKSFCKDTVSNTSVDPIYAQKTNQERISYEYIVKTILQLMGGEGYQLKENISKEQLKIMLTDRMIKYRMRAINEVVIQLVHKIQSLINFEEQQILSAKNWGEAFQQYSDYDQLSIKSLSELCEHIFKKLYSCHYLPINSKSNSEQSCNGQKHLMLYSRNSQTQLKKQLQEQRCCNQLIKKEKNELNNIINRLQSDMKNAQKQLKIQQQKYSTLIANNPFEGMMHEKQKQIIQLQQQIMALREQSTRMKLKSKKGKVFRIDH